MTERTAPTILAIFAHPDDEIGAGSTLAHYSDAGVRVVLACATRGEACTIYCQDCATGETIAQVRTQELACACEHLGIHELRWLDWPDGGVSQLPRDEAVAQVAALIEDVRPTIVITHPENGLYPHPDHLAVWEIVRAAYIATAADAAPEMGDRPARLFTRAMPQSFFDRAPGLAEFRVALNGQLLPFMGTPDAEIDVLMRVEPWVPRRMAAWDCHRSQHNPDGFTAALPDDVRQEMAANEHFLLIAGVPLPPGVNDDLFAGLTEDDTLMFEAASGDAAPDADLPDPALADESAGEQVRRLRAELAHHITLAEVLRIYQHDPREPKQAKLYQQLNQAEQEVIYRIARAVRRLDAPAGKVEPNISLLRAARRMDQPGPRHDFLLGQFEAAHARLKANAETAAGDEELAAWQELVVLTKSSLEMLAE